MPIRVLEFYSGIGGLHLALSRSGIGSEVVQALDWDQNACLVYNANHGNNVAKKIDISTLTTAQLASYHADLWLLSPACQPYTVLNPNAKGAQDPRAQSFLHLVQVVLPELAASNNHPDRMLVENVAGFEDSSTRQILISSLRALGYETLELLLTPLQFGIPNSRLRYYLLAKKAPLRFSDIPSGYSGEVWRQIPGQGLAWTDPRLDERGAASDDVVRELREYLDKDDQEGQYDVPDKVLQKWGRLFDIVKPSSRRTCCFTRGYTQLVERAGSILQENEELDTTEIFDHFLASQAAGDPDAVKLLHPLKLRYFSPPELLRIFAFDPIEDPTKTGALAWPKTTSRKSKYKFIGNSINVEVVQKLIRYLFLEPK
ncbi:hypothetical protein D9619_006256 [Psilocybe cf. subviscida]|uniref:tRNA (cytosine(38)-C(5))-methyltransferase n=1 Tax=Psilocybe cf. subviscida TaxID=2480587 RepID=A0A8H5B4R2_9AGAR|nr:hypothetical protein D9619_006256 [Psilocybe cf. subviscida]